MFIFFQIKANKYLIYDNTYKQFLRIAKYCVIWQNCIQIPPFKQNIKLKISRLLDISCRLLKYKNKNMLRYTY